MATYTNSGGLTKPATGEFSGTWGTIANTNFDIIDRLVNGVTSIPLTSTPYSLATSDGVLSVGQYLLINFTGSLGGTVTVNITPQDATKIYFIRNTSNSSVIMSQGSGSTVTIPTGQSKLVYTDGAGAGASVSDFTSFLSMSSAQITGGAISGASVSTSSATITGGTISGITDLAVADGGTGASTLTGYVKGAGTTALTASATIPSTDITGLGTMATQDASAVAITGGTITGITDIAIADGGTGASTAADALINFGLTATATELNYTDGVTSAIQTQLDAKAPLLSPALTGTPTAPTAAAGTNTTQVATTAFALANSTGMTLLGTLTTTSGSTQTLSGLVLTSYKQLVLEWNLVSHSNISNQTFSIGAGQVITGIPSGDFVAGMVTVSLVSGIASPILSRNPSLPNNLSGNAQVCQTGYSTATTSVSVSVSTGPFDAGSVTVYGVK